VIDVTAHVLVLDCFFISHFCAQSASKRFSDSHVQYLLLTYIYIVTIVTDVITLPHPSVLCACPRAYLRNCSSKLRQFFSACCCPVTRLFSDGVTIRYMFPVAPFAIMSHYDSVTLPQQPRCNAVNRLTPMLHGTRPWRAPRLDKSFCGIIWPDLACVRVNRCINTPKIQFSIFRSYYPQQNNIICNVQRYWTPLKYQSSIFIKYFHNRCQNITQSTTKIQFCPTL